MRCTWQPSTRLTCSPCSHRIVRGDWGELDSHDTKENEEAVKHGYRILSAYGKGDERLWIITEAHPILDLHLATRGLLIERNESMSTTKQATVNVDDDG